MGKKKKVDESIEQQAYCSARTSWFAFAVLCVMAFIALIPLLWIIISSFKVEKEVIQAGGFLYLPKTWTLDNFKELLSADNKQLPIYFWFVNSIIVSGSQTLLTLTPRCILREETCFFTRLCSCVPSRQLRTSSPCIR